MTVDLRAVSREAEGQLKAYWTLLKRWNAAVRLIAPISDESGWQRHIADSIQLADHFPPRSVVHCDLGSGGGLPAIPVGLLRRDAGFEDRLIMIEADKRKAAFLKTATRELGLHAQVVSERLEHTDRAEGEIVTVRALAPLDRLLHYVERHLEPSGWAIVPKGRSVDRELELARRRWAFEFERHPSRTATDASILVISDLKRSGGDDEA